MTENDERRVLLEMMMLMFIVLNNMPLANLTGGHGFLNNTLMTTDSLLPYPFWMKKATIVNAIEPMGILNLILFMLAISGLDRSDIMVLYITRCVDETEWS